MSYECVHCNYILTDLKDHLSHISKHKNLPNFLFDCAVCKLKFKSYNAIRSHLLKNHKDLYINKPPVKLFDIFCKSCDYSTSDKHFYTIHIFEHLENHIEIVCNIQNCTQVYKNKNSFKSHYYRNHHGWLDGWSFNVVPDEDDSVCVTTPDTNEVECSASDSDFFNEIGLGADSEMSLSGDNTNLSLLLIQMSTFLLKLESKLLVPKTAIQIITTTFLDLIETNNADQLSQFKDKLEELAPSTEGLNLDTVQEVLSNHLFKSVIGETGLLRSDYLRKKFYSSNLTHVEPIKLLLGRNDNHVPCFAYYVPIHKTIEALLENQNLCRKIVENTKTQPQSSSNILRGVSDGYVYKRIHSKMNHLPSLNIILYQDSFEVCNPLGSSKVKHKVFAMYYRLDVQERSKIDPIQLVLLTYDKYLKMFTQDQIFGTLINDLKNLEKNGINIKTDLDNINILPFISCICGDNLGSHYLGGYTENFSTSIYFCRYCEVDRPSFRENPCVKGICRTYDEHLKNVGEYELSKNFEDSKGVRNDSVFNNLKYFNTVIPGLPPCAAHDLFEGVVQVDLPLIIKYLIGKDLFTAAYLNNKMKELFSLIRTTAYCPFSFKSKKLKGNSTQNMYFLLFLPMAIHDKITDFNDEAWLMLKLLVKISQLVLSNKITIDETGYIDTMTEEYLFLRHRKFLNKLIPKHHYLNHYGELTRAFGPLINVWTLPFEQKHKYFKNVVRHCPNFINVLFSLSEKHQLLQTYLTLNTSYDSIVSDSSQLFTEFSLSSQLEEFLSKNQDLKKLKNLQISTKISFASYVYKKEDSVCFESETNVYLKCIKIKHILFEPNTENPIFVGFEEQFDYISDKEIYIQTKQEKKYFRISFKDLIFQKPCYIYKSCITNETHLILAHF